MMMMISLFAPQWYSWLVSSLADSVYLFGFIGMTPQLFINYKLKSVAHLPWRVMAYKAFNTFVRPYIRVSSSASSGGASSSRSRRVVD